MREIKFRGMTIKGDWVYGNLSVLPNKLNESTPPGSYISNSYGMPFAYHIRPETAGQLTGLKDKNGVEIYEGDVVKITHGDKHYWLYEISTAGEYFGNCLFAMLIEHNSASKDDTYTYEVEKFDKTVRQYVQGGDNVEVIGSIHENPELLN